MVNAQAPDRVEVGVERHVVLGSGQRRRRQIDRVHRSRSPCSRVHAEAAGGREHVEDIASRRDLTDADTVRTLVEEVARLLPGAHVGIEFQASFHEPDRAVGQVAGDHVAVDEPEGLAGLQVAGEAQHDAAATGEIEQRIDHRDQVGEPDGRVQLDHQDAREAIDDETGHAVVLAVEHAVREPVCVGGAGERRSDVERCTDRRSPPAGIDRRRFADVEDPELDRRVRVVERECDELAVVVEDHRDVADLGLVADRGDRFLEDPRVPGADVSQRIGRHAHGETLVARPRNTEQPSMQRWAAHGWNDAITPTSGVTSPE